MRISTWKCFSLAVLFLMLGAFGCGSSLMGGEPTVGTVNVRTSDFFGIGEKLAQDLVKNRRGNYGVGRKLVLTTLVNLDALHQTSRFGRAVSEAMATQLFQQGYGLVEIRKINSILIRDDAGEIILSRDAARLAGQHEADMIVAGTYSLTPNTVIINVKFLDVLSKEVISAAGLELHRSKAIDYLLSGGGGVSDAALSAYEL